MTASSQPRIPRPPLAAPLRIGLILLLLAALFWVWRPVQASPEALAAADRYFMEEYPGYTFQQPQTQSSLFGSYTLVYATSHRGTPARLVVELSREAGQLRVQSAQLYIGAADSRRYVTWGISLAATLALVYLVFFVSIPRTFGRKCPRDLTLLKVTEEVVVPGRTHISGLSLAPIIERIHTCRVCDFRHHEAMMDPLHRPSMPMKGFPGGVAEIYFRDIDKMLEKSNELRMKNAITTEEDNRVLADAKEAARAKSSSDSPWLYGS